MVTQPEDQMAITHITKGWSLQQEEQEEMQKVMDEVILRHETTNWLKRTDWSAHFTGRNLMDIQACSKMPGRGDEGYDELLRVETVWLRWSDLLVARMWILSRLALKLINFGYGHKSETYGT
ncbi:hypothetical protein DER44DRAFT_834408 [Fusarium oxysporum]|nr:hypothetical protein DER44DRAFT_834408 [Fusarium oxysporum]